MRTEMIEKDGIFQSPDYIGDLKSLEDGSETLLEMLHNVTKRCHKKEFLGTINTETQIVEYESYGAVFKKMKRIGAFLRANKPSSSSGDTKDIIGIFSVNKTEWFVSEYGIYMANMINCPLYSTFGAESIRYILNQTEMEICFVSGIKAVSLYDDVIKDGDFRLRIIVTYEKLDEELVRKYNEKKIDVILFSDLTMAENDENSDVSSKDSGFSEENENYEGSRKSCKDKDLVDLPFEDLPTSDSIATICYTSGTSGVPKGVILSHKNFICTIAGFILIKPVSQIFEIVDDDVYISYLPLAHVMERVCSLMVMAKGARIAFFRGNPKLLQQDMKIIKPTFLVGVPRVFNVFKEKIEEAIRKKSFLLRVIVNFAFKAKIAQQKRGKYKHWFWDWLVFNKIHAEFGGCIRGSLNGSAPLSGKVTEYLQAIISSRIFQGYGQTEGTAANILMTLDDFENERVGIPFPSNLVKLCPTDDYTGGMKGEIYLKGNNIASGYYKREDLNKDTFDDGWLRTGDIGVIEDDVFKVVGRRKEIFKTSHGEYIIPEKIENVLKAGIIDDVLVTGKSLGDFIVAIVVCKNEKIEPEEVLSKLTMLGEKACKNGLLTRYEIPRKIHVIRRDFDSYGEMLTPTLKKKRGKIEGLFEKEIFALYENK